MLFDAMLDTALYWTLLQVVIVLHYTAQLCSEVNCTAMPCTEILLIMYRSKETAKI